jgi:tetratricopeptide (TPR) repeat protein
MRLRFAALALLLISTTSSAAAPEGGKPPGKKETKSKADELVKAGEKAYLAGNLEEALAAFQKVIKKVPGDYRGYYYCGMIFGEKGKKEEAEKMYKAALGKNPALPEANNNLAVLLQEKKQFEEAEKLFGQALKADPAYFEAQFNLGYLYEEWGKPDKAVKAYLAAAKISGKDTEALLAVAQIEEGRGKWQEAAQAYRKAIERDGSLIGLKVEIAAALRKQGKNEEAVKELDELLAAVVIADGADLAVPFKAARELRLAGKPKKALDTLLKFPSKAKGTFSVKTEIGQCHLALGSCSKAAAVFKDILKDKPDHPEVLLALGDSYTCAKKCKEAAEAYGKFLQKTDESDKRRAEVLKKIKSCKK